MLRYKLRTLLIVLALGPPALAGFWLVAAEMRGPRLRGCFGDDLVRSMKSSSKRETKRSWVLRLSGS